MTEIITKEEHPTLMECLKAFDGAKGETVKKKEDYLTEKFKELATKMIYGGYFEVISGNDVVRQIYIHTVEFYYHEESPEEDPNAVRDYIVYHRNARKSKSNPNPTDNPLPPFPIGSLHTHISGIDITFEDNESFDQKNKKFIPKYRASALIRSFRVVDLTKTKKDELKSKETEKPDNHSTHLYNALFMDTPVRDYLNIRIKWIDFKKWKGDFLDQNHRKNVGEYFNKKDRNGNPMYIKKDPFKQDERPWAFSRDPFKE